MHSREEQPSCIHCAPPISPVAPCDGRMHHGKARFWRAGGRKKRVDVERLSEEGRGGRTIDAKTAIICPQALCGTISPYPTVVIVILAQYIAMPMELNSESSTSWSGFSQ
jgi:hypothetical protein